MAHPECSFHLLPSTNKKKTHLRSNVGVLCVIFYISFTKVVMLLTFGKYDQKGKKQVQHRFSLLAKLQIISALMPYFLAFFKMPNEAS